MDISRMCSFPAHVLGINSSTICFCYDTVVSDISGLSWDIFLMEKGHLSMCYLHWLIKKLPWPFGRTEN